MLSSAISLQVQILPFNLPQSISSRHKNTDTFIILPGSKRSVEGSTECDKSDSGSAVEESVNVVHCLLDCVEMIPVCSINKEDDAGRFQT